MEKQQIENIFTYHSPTAEQQVKYRSIRAEAKIFAEMINEICPESREKSLAITKLQELVMWANAAIAINE